MDGVFDEKATNAIRSYFIGHHQTISVAESVTTGLIQSAIGGIPDASQFYQGGITAYNLGQKYRHLLIEPIHALSCNCVSDKIAGQMALNVCTLFNSEWGIGITGYAVPVPESGDKIFAHYAIAANGKIILTAKITSSLTQPLDVQLFYVNKVLKQLALVTNKIK